MENLTSSQKKDLAFALCVAMNFADLPFSDWFSIVAALKNLGFSADEVLQMCEGSEKFNAGEVRAQYNSAHGDFDLTTIMGKAKTYAPNFDYKAFLASLGTNYQSKAQPTLKTAVNAFDAVKKSAKAEKSAEELAQKQAKLELIRADLNLPNNLDRLGKWRGLYPSSLKVFGCIYVEKWTPIWARLKNFTATPTPRVLVPAGEHYLARLVGRLETFSGAKDFQYIKEKPHEGTKHPFGLQTITSKTRYVVISEGEIDAVSIVQALEICAGDMAAEIACVATCSAIHGGAVADEIISKIESFTEKPKAVILYDNDDTGRKIAPQLRQYFIDRGFLAACAFLPARQGGGKRDANDILVEGDDGNLHGTAGEYELTRLILSAIDDANIEIENRIKAETQKLLGLSAAEFLTEKFPAVLEKRKKFAERRTGFSNLDAEIGALIPTIIALAGTPGVGKTSFAIQLADQLADSGLPVVYVSLEMGAAELIAKILARRVYIAEGCPRGEEFSPLTANKILQGKFYEHAETYNAVLEEFQRENSRLFIWELENEGIDEILARVEKICAKLETPPVVFIDYFQLLACGCENFKFELDKSLFRLKNFQRKHDATFILLSSVNRGAYYRDFAPDNLKETGGIEYTAEVIWGLQYCLDEGTARTPAEIAKAQKENPRHVQLTCLKNRFGRYYDAAFWYSPTVDLFNADEEYGGYIDYIKGSDGLQPVQNSKSKY